MNRIGRSGSLRLPLGQDVYADNPPPRTPPSQSSSYNKPSKRGLHPRPSLRETFLDDFNPTDNTNNSSNESSDERDSHDLSLSPNHATRTSIVDNMLLSLDQFALSSGPSILDDYRLFNSVFESDTYRRDSEDSMAETRYRGHTFSSSLSSEPDFGYSDGTVRYGAQPPSSRRSNGSTTYHSSLKRIGSSREGPGTRPQLYDFRANTGSGSATHAVRRSSKGSGPSNLDFGPPLIRGRGDSTSERRSVSLDYGTRQPYVPFVEPTSDYDSLSYDGMDAAPTPSVPAGPRKFQSSQNDYSRTLNTQSSRTPVVSRRNSIKSARTNNTKKSRPDNIGTGTIMRDRDNDLTNRGEDDIDPPPAIPASLDPPAPSPTVSFNKPIFPTPPDPIPTKERTGFFRRVFGSSKNSSPGPSENNRPELALSQENDHKDANVAGRRQPLRNNASATNTTRQGPPQVVNKKPSFFRRRKKSVSLVDNVPLPIALPQELGPKAMEILKAEPSPVSSWSQAMTSFLDDSVTQADDQANEFTNRGAGADDAENKNTEPLLAQTQKEGVPSAVDGGLKSKSNLHTLPSSASGHDTSFFINSSGDDDSTAKSGDLETSSSADPWQGQMAVSGDIQSRDSEKTGQIVGASQSLIAAQDIGSFSPLSPVIEGFPQNSAARIENSGATEPEDPAKGVQSPSPYKDNQIQPSKLSIPVAGTNESPQVSPSEASNYYTATSTPALPSEDPRAPEMTESIAESSDTVPTDGLSSSDREQAKKLFDSQDEVVGNAPACAWLGDPDRAKIREAYMGHFDWPSMNILAALRSLCNRLVLKGETQQVDRVLDAFSTRWCQCNPRHGFKAADVVHTICYSLLLLNTDLHLADIEQKMTKNQFVRNTIPTIRRVAIDAAPGGFETVLSANQQKSSTQDTTSLRSPGLDDHPNRPNDRPINPPAKLVNRLSRTDLSMRLTGDSEGEIGLLVTAPFHGTMRAWEQHVETVLREFYSSIQKQRLPLHGAPTERDGPRGSSNLLAPGPAHGLRRSPSTISKSGSDIYPRGRSADSRYGTARWSSKPRSRARLYPTSTMASSRTSLDDQSSLWSPSGSSTWSKYSLGKFTSASVESFGSEYPRGDYQQAIGFANALSQAIIREDAAHSIASSEDPERTTQLLEDETLQLAGAPWAKEGNLQHKHHLDSVDKRAKDRNWNECFAVIQQGWMRLFSFNNSTKSARQKSKQRGGVVVGGGNWTENAEEIWKFLLRQTIASALPSPGYSKSRPHVWALSLPTGAVHLFQAGTPEIVREFVSTANYWSARLSKQPLIGGIGNMEYGWSDAVINSALINSDKNRDKNRTPPPSSNPRSSIQSSIRSSLDQQVVGVRPKLPADRVHLGDWAPPQQSMVASALAEADQLKALQTYVKNVEDELQRHNELRPAMVLAFSPRHPNAMKAMANWERKSSYLLREIVKFRTYIDSLQGAIRAKNKIYASYEDDNSSS